MTVERKEDVKKIDLVTMYKRERKRETREKKKLDIKE